MVTALQMRVEYSTGNLAQFKASIGSVGPDIRRAIGSNISAPLTSRAPNLSLGNMSSVINSANNMMTSTGTVLDRTVAGYAGNIRKLSALNASLSASGAKGAMGAAGVAGGPAAMNYAAAGAVTPTGAVYGTGYNAQGVPGVYAKDLKPQYQTTEVGQFKTIVADVAKVNAAIMQLAGYQKDMTALSQKEQIGLLKATAQRNALLEQQLAIQKSQTAEELKLEALYRRGGGVAPVFDKKTGALLTPGVLKASPTKAQIEQLATSAEYQATRMTSFVQSPQIAGPKGLIPVTVKPTDEQLNKIIKQDITNANKGIKPTAVDQAGGVGVTNLQLAIAQSRASQGKSILAIESLLKTDNATLAKIATGLNLNATQAKAFTAKINALRASTTAGYAPQLQALKDAQLTPAIPAQLDKMLAGSKQLQRQVTQKLGITSPYGTMDFAKQLDAQVTSVDVTRDYSKGLNQMTMDIQKATGETGKLTAATDNSGRVIQKTTGGYRNASSALGQVGQDFKKVLEWTIATTVVFGAFGAAIGTISKINTVNMDLQRFQIVAKTTGAETKAMFDAFAQIAYITATPLAEMTSVMDDIALATRKAGQTSQEWATDMKALATAVGIFTNIAGIDTVKATEQLSAAFKQLQIAPEALIGIMNKVSAVAGGNAQAMTDIVTALGTVAEAAKASMMSVDQQIAAVQVLSQVTNKTPADLATSFKNLFGAISSPASVKELKKFNIDVRDTQGNLKGFVPIYQEVYDAIQKGIIPAGQVQDVLRGIAGGPRRAPDAAAILGNWPKIMATVAISADATNEALIANAKIVDTNSAKLQKLKTAFETALVNQFSEAITNLVGDFTGLAESIGKVLSIFNLGGGNFLGSITTTIIKFAALAGGIIILTKGLGALRGGLAGVAVQLGLLNTLSKVGMLSGLGGNATLGAGGVLTTTAKLAQSERPGYARFVDANGKYQYMPITNPTYVNKAGKTLPTPNYIGPNPPVPKALNIVPRPLAGASQALSDSRGLRLGVSGAAGAAAGLGLGLASAATGNGTFSSIGQTLGLMGIMSFQPELIAAGALTLAVSTLFQTWSDGAEKAAAKQAQLESDVYDSIKTVQANQSAYDTLQTTQKNAQNTMDALKNKTNLTTDETSTLNAANEDYISSTLSMMDAEKALLDSRDKLLQQLPQLQKYQDLAKQAASLKPEDLKPLVAVIAQDILTASGTITPGGTTNWQPLYPTTGPKSPQAWGPGNKQQGTPQEPWYVADMGGQVPAYTPEKLTERFQKNGISDVIAFLRDPGTFTEGAGVSKVTPALTTLINTMMTGAVEDVRNSPDYKEAQTQLGKLMQLPGAMTPWQTLGTNLAGLKAQTGAQITTGALGGPEAANAQLRQSIANQMAYASRNAPEATTQAAYQGSQFVPGQIGKVDIAKKIEALVKAGVGPTGEALPQTGELTAVQLRSYYAELTKLNPALVDGANNVGTFDEMTYRWAKSLGDTGTELDKLHHPLVLLADDLTTLREGIEAARMAGLSDLADQWNTLQAQIQSGQFAGTASDATAQKAQIEAQMTLWNDASDAFNAYSSGLPMLAEELGKLQQFQKLNFLDKAAPEYLQQIIPVVMSSVGTYNLSAEAINKVKAALVDLALQDSIIAKMPNMTLGNILSASPEVLATLAAIQKKELDIQTLTKSVVSTPADAAAKVINASRDTALTSLFNKRNDLQAQIQGGEFTSTKEDPGAAARGQAQLDQTNALIKDNYKLADSFSKNASAIPGVTAALSKLKVFENLKLINMDDVKNYGSIIDVLNGIATQYGLTGAAADAYSQTVINLVNIYAQIAAMPNIVKTITIVSEILSPPSLTATPGYTPAVSATGFVTGTHAITTKDSAALTALKTASNAEIAKLQKIISSSAGSSFATKPAAAEKAAAAPAVNVGTIDVPDEWIKANVNVGAYLKNAVDWAKKYQTVIPGEDKAHQTDLVAVMQGNTRVLLQKGIAEEYLNKAIGNLTDEIKKQNDLLKKADTIRRIRVGAGDFAALANVPINKASGVSVGSPQGPITISLNITGQVLTKAQTEQIGNSIAAALGSQITNG